MEGRSRATHRKWRCRHRQQRAQSRRAAANSTAVLRSTHAVGCLAVSGLRTAAIAGPALGDQVRGWVGGGSASLPCAAVRPSAGSCASTGSRGTSTLAGIAQTSVGGLAAAAQVRIVDTVVSSKVAVWRTRPPAASGAHRARRTSAPADNKQQHRSQTLARRADDVFGDLVDQDHSDANRLR